MEYFMSSTYKHDYYIIYSVRFYWHILREDIDNKAS